MVLAYKKQLLKYFFLPSWATPGNIFLLNVLSGSTDSRWSLLAGAARSRSRIPKQESNLCLQHTPWASTLTIQLQLQCVAPRDVTHWHNYRLCLLDLRLSFYLHGKPKSRAHTADAKIPTSYHGGSSSSGSGTELKKRASHY